MGRTRAARIAASARIRPLDADRSKDHTIPAPVGERCPYCRRLITAGDTNIVRFNTRIYHRNPCFAFVIAHRDRHERVKAFHRHPQVAYMHVI